MIAWLKQKLCWQDMLNSFGITTCEINKTLLEPVGFIIVASYHILT